MTLLDIPPETPPDLPDGYWDSKPGDTFALDADVTLYWPQVRPCWEDR